MKVTMTEIPRCDVCHVEGIERPAYADAKIPGAAWFYVCKRHFLFYGCRLGTGHGERLLKAQ